MILSKAIEDAIKENNMSRIYSSFYTILLSDPAFATGKFDLTLNELKARNIKDLFQKYDGEAFKGQNEWNQQYWDSVASALMDNFCVERIEHLKEISRFLYPKIEKKDECNNVSDVRSEKKNDIYTIFGSEIEHGKIDNGNVTRIDNSNFDDRVNQVKKDACKVAADKNQKMFEFAKSRFS